MKRQRFSVATFNLYNLQLPGRDMHPGQTPWTQEQYERKVAWTGSRLVELDADIVGLQELWHRDAMVEILAASGLAGQYDLVAEPADGTTIVTAALVRTGLLVGSPEWIQDFPDALRLESTRPMDVQSPAIDVRISGFSRPVLHLSVTLREDQPNTEVYVTHLKSKLPSRIDEEDWFVAAPDTFKPHRKAIGSALATIRRTAEAAALRVLLTDVMKTTATPVIVLGDINDGQHSNTLNIVTEQPRYLLGISTGGVDNGLYTAQTLQQFRDTRDVYYTHVFQDLRESLDHVLVSEQFYDLSRERVWLFDGLTIENDHLNEDDHKETGTGDHGIVKVAFRYRPAG